MLAFPATQAECLKALCEFKNENSPGTDGLQAEFYKHFWKELHVNIINSFNFAYDGGTLSISQRRGIITLIPQPNKNTTLFNNLRPISLQSINQALFIHGIPSLQMLFQKAVS